MKQFDAIRIAAIGDEFVAGIGDKKALGWLGRVAARTPQHQTTVEIYPLAVPQEGTAALSARWHDEATHRYSEETDNRLLLALGTRDIDLDLSTSRSRLHVANVVDEAISEGIKVFVVGPTPSADIVRNVRIATLNESFADVATRRNLPYIDMYTPLVKHEQWNKDLTTNGGVHPGQAGYGLMAWLVLHRGWFNWLGIDPE